MPYLLKKKKKKIAPLGPRACQGGNANEDIDWKKRIYIFIYKFANGWMCLPSLKAHTSIQ